MSFAPPQLLANIDEDGFFSGALKPQLINALNACLSVSDAELVFLEFCAAHAHLHPGPAVIGFTPSELLGSLRHFKALSRWLAKATAIALTDIEYFLEKISDPTTSAIVRRKAEILFNARITGRGISVTEATCWVYRNPRDVGRSPFYGRLAECLPWQLGLPRAGSGQKYIVVNFDCSRGGPYRKPTVLDTTFEGNEFWRPGGRAVPRSDTPATCTVAGMAPLEEMLSPPVPFSAVVLPLVLIIAR